MIDSSISIKYKLVPHGTKKTDLFFYPSIDSILKIFIHKVTESSQYIFCTDTNVSQIPQIKQFLQLMQSNNHPVITIPSGEENKTIDSVLSIIQKALDNSFSRNCTFVAIGGGVISDITAFATSLFKRGANLEIIPTTLLSMVDASIGGKTGCDFFNYKNMVGTFYPASKIYFSSQFLLTLPTKEFKSGLGEVIKTALLYSKKLLHLLSQHKDEILAKDLCLLDLIITQCAKAKSSIVQKDISEKNVRKELNLGHTFAHALESVAGLGNVTHGEAVAWGLARQADLSKLLNICNDEYVKQVNNILDLYDFCTNKKHPCITNIDDANKKIITAMYQDKKNTDDNICFVIQKKVEKSLLIKTETKNICAIL